MTVDQAKLEKVLEKMLGDLGAAASGALVLIGDKLGLYRALAEKGSATPAQLAAQTQTAERYVSEWLAAQAAAGYVIYNDASETYSISPEFAAVLADESSPAFVAGAYELIGSMYKDEPKITAAFRSGNGVGWHEHSACLFRGTERFFRAGYAAHLVDKWLPSLDGVCEKLNSGAIVADVGCGHGASTILMAAAFPRSQFVGFDYHPASIERAQIAARDAGVAGHCRFEVADSKKFPGKDFDLVAFFDCLHDMGDPVGAARHVRKSLKPDGTWLIVEPMAGDNLMANLNPVGRLYYAASTMICVPASLSQDVGAALGAQAGEARLRHVVTSAGFTRFRRATETPFNLILEARP